MKNRIGRPSGALGIALIAIIALTGLFATAASAAPKGEYAAFYDCPTSNPEVAGCLQARTESGEIKLGKQAVPILKTQTLQGGFGEEEVEFGPVKFFGAADGNTFSKTPQNVPGGLLGLVNCTEIKGEGLIEKGLRATCKAIFESGPTAVTATTELAVPPSGIILNENFLLGEVFTALTLPVKVKLDNTLLGSECYIGSNSSPITLNLTTGTTAPKAPNKPIKGKLGTITTRAESRILVIKNNTLVDNNFSAPGTSGCGIFGLLDGTINSKIGLPSAAGNNTAILNSTLEQTGINAAREHE
jgi:hypothetical protein